MILFNIDESQNDVFDYDSLKESFMIVDQFCQHDITFHHTLSSMMSQFRGHIFNLQDFCRQSQEIEISEENQKILSFLDDDKKNFFNNKAKSFVKIYFDNVKDYREYLNNTMIDLLDHILCIDNIDMIFFVELNNVLKEANNKLKALISLKKTISTNCNDYILRYSVLFS